MSSISLANSALLNTHRKEGAMIASMTVSDLIAELLEAGMKQEDIARRLGIKRPNISNLKKGKQSLDDASLPVLVDLVYERLGRRLSVTELKAHKWIYWVMREKGLSLEQIRGIINKMDASGNN